MTADKSYHCRLFANDTVMVAAKLQQSDQQPFDRISETTFNLSPATMVITYSYYIVMD